MKKLKLKVQVNVLCLHKGEWKVLLLKLNKRRGSFWQSVTGKVDKDDVSFASAALREAKEETSFPRRARLELIDLNMDFEYYNKELDRHYYEKIYCLKLYTPWEVEIDPKEHCEFKWVPLSKIGTQDVEFLHNQKALQKCQILFG